MNEWMNGRETSRMARSGKPSTCTGSKRDRFMRRTRVRNDSSENMERIAEAAKRAKLKETKGKNNDETTTTRRRREMCVRNNSSENMERNAETAMLTTKT